VPVGPLRQFDGRTPTKILIIDDPERIKGICPEFQREFGDRLYVTITTPEYLEFMNKAVDKATGVAEAVASLGVPRERTAAVGDALNDQPMIEWAGLGCAMGNADPPVLAAADVVAPSNDEDGLAWFIREYVL
jgi:HAD superfamily hydrolase (TIGR01484 family)